MGSPLPEDPYLALGLPKDTTPGAIKTQYRKLVLKFHPDKVQDPTLKEAAVDQFHKIQTAYEILGDEDRRARYDAQCKLAELRKDVMERQGGGGGGRTSDVRTAAYKMPTESVRGGSFFARGPERSDRDAPKYEERRPAHAAPSTTDYFDTASRVGSRRDGEHERSSKRSPTQDDRERIRTAAVESKEEERLRQREKDMRREKEINKERVRKQSHVAEESDSDADDYERRRRRSKEQDDLRRTKATYEPARRDRDEAARGYYDDERAHKLSTQYDGAREYMEKLHPKQRPEDDGRPSAMRMSSSRDKIDFIKREGRPAAMVRRGSSRQKPSSREPEERRKSPREGERREGERRSSAEIDVPRRAPPLTSAKSSPADIRLPSEKQRAHSVQIETQKEDFVPPKFKRSETMPNVYARESRKEPQKGSRLRQTEMVDGYPTPAPTPNVSGSEPSKYKYHQEYADDHEYPTPDGYRTELREPTGGAKSSRYLTRSPSPIRDRERERERDKVRAASARYAAPEQQRPTPVPRTTSTSYVYTPTGGVETYAARPSLTRDSSKLNRSLYGEVPTTRESSSPRQPAGRYPPPPSTAESVKYRPEDIKVQSGYGTRRPSVGTRPSYSRQGSGYSTVYVK